MDIQQVDESSLRALGQAYLMIVASEIGDKTFLIAAIMAMRHPRSVVFAGAFSSLLVMSVLSAEMGHFLPTLIPKKYTQLAAALLFLVFGVKMLLEAKEMKGGNEKIQEEMREVEQEIEEEDSKTDGTGGVGENGERIPLEVLEEGTVSRDHLPPPITSPPSSESLKSYTSLREGTRNFFSLFLGPVFVQTFVLTFLGEWGDRSQIATIALAAAHNVYVVALGTIVGHGCCTALAVIGGRWLSTKISVKHGKFFILYCDIV
ncbi:UPF0016-domain-containing protein [Sistotremastrum suecicum HHB10207 ss-3]|uniref:GDT1 family protein n=1 Tax=Sistotremastrum suecicum HHB10207 ss-3 TaxID=1314776 RepID=A0A165X8A2_9AGAM|nr:UPF0016-domain-containing protein [Sistotremastrum suecicum HHB10207 ss-3]